MSFACGIYDNAKTIVKRINVVNELLADSNITNSDDKKQYLMNRKDELTKIIFQKQKNLKDDIIDLEKDIIGWQKYKQYFKEVINDASKVQLLKPEFVYCEYIRYEYFYDSHSSIKINVPVDKNKFSDLKNDICNSKPIFFILEKESIDYSLSRNEYKTTFLNSTNDKNLYCIHVMNPKPWLQIWIIHKNDVLSLIDQLLLKH
jgi:sugar-specific transcriptional regulator TrmB